MNNLKLSLALLLAFVIGMQTVCAQKSSGQSGKASSKASSALSSVVSNFTATKNFNISDIVGTWSYQSPAVSFKSKDIVKKIGGVAASSVVEAKLEPYYKKAGIEGMMFTVNADSTFTMKLTRGSLSGAMSKDNDENLQFDFKVAGITVSSIEAHAAKSASTLSLTFDMSKLIALLKIVSSVTNAEGLSTVSSLLSSYDGIYAGFKFKLVSDKQQK